jgi:hypothetical protein
VLTFLSAIFKLFLAIGPYKIALYPITRLVAVPIKKMNGIDPNLEFVLRKEEGPTGLDLVIPWLQIELPPLYETSI